MHTNIHRQSGLGAYDNANDELAQTITLPAGTTLTLRFWWPMTTLEANHPWDTLDVVPSQ